MKRLALFAGYDKDGLIDDYVVFYLKNLSESADIIYVADCQISEFELDKIRPYTLKTIATRHEEYDFGSYKRAYLYAKENKILENYDYLILCNDSVYGPFFNLQTIIENMENQNTDVYGLFEYAHTKDIEKHLQSYFIAMTKPVFLNEEFENFISSVKKEKSKQDVVDNYEIALSILFRKLGFTMTSFLDSSIKILRYDDPNVPSTAPLNSLKKGFPFLKINALTLNRISMKEIVGIFDLIKPYHQKLIFNHLERILTDDKKKDFFDLTTFYIVFKDKVCFYSEHCYPSRKYRIILRIFGKKIFSISKKIPGHNFEKIKDFLH